ncbi:cellulose biosynthesis protein BcsG [Trinickia sp. LjRoot230]|uniref:cellulose biosynthesis protein BcsG n=1 Tax=Trinickia sp. LjRoot230 TaxID=3342288 RepID=UPI003ECDD557
MTFWNLYFILKLALYAAGHLTPLWLANLAFVGALALTSPIRHRGVRALRLVVGLAVAIPLFYREAHVPPFARLVEVLRGLESFSLRYWIEIVPRVVPPALLVAAAIALIVYFIVNRWLRVASFVVIALVAWPIWNAVSVAFTPGQARAAVAHTAVVDQPLDHQAALAAFRTQEAQREVTFGHLSGDSNAQFDVIVLHICSLSWDDLDVSKTRNNPMLSHFDYLFTNFSAAASYSGPAAIRVLRATCGQEAHADLYKDAPAQCHLFAQLAQAGYTPQVLLNHDGHFDNFLDVVKTNLGVPDVRFMPNDKAATSMHAFDGSPLKDDYSTLAAWYAQRANTRGPVALYYNTISLHDGNRLVSNERLSSIDSYPLRVTTLMNEIDAFADLVAKSGRRAAIIVVPEHGAALRGDGNQVAGLREIPTPRIIHGPVGIRLVGLQGSHGPTIVIDTPTSFLAVAQLLSNLVSNSPFKPGVVLSQYATGLPQTPMIGENEGTVTMKTASGYAVKTPDGVWVEQQ